MDIGNTNSFISSELILPSHYIICCPPPPPPHSLLEGKSAAVELLGGPEPCLLGRRAAQQEELVWGVHELQLLPRVGVGSEKQSRNGDQGGKGCGEGANQFALTPNKGNMLRPKDYRWWTEATRQVLEPSLSLIKNLEFEGGKITYPAER